MARQRAFFWTVLIVGSGGAALGEPAAPLPPFERQSLEAFAAAHRTCQAWTDGCIVCRRQTPGAFACSTPGIACRSLALICQATLPAAGKADGRE